ncbi:MAG: GGDEF domain-containing protein [Steroidobacteraceae bacterium]|nr:GGDEF domain-containing protein [Steroidobacteraceae bacterium]
MHDSPAAGQLRRGFLWLRFERGLEAEYWRDHFEQGRLQLRTGFLLAVVLAAAFIAMHHRILPPPDLPTLVLRYGIVFPLLTAGFAATLVAGTGRLLRALVAVAAPTVVVAVTALVLLGERHAGQSVFPVLVITTMFVYYLLGQSFYGALRTGAIGFVAFLAGAWLIGLAQEAFAYQVLLLAITNLVGGTVAYTLEAARRTAWLEARLLAEMADRDGLTGIHNRRCLDAHLHAAWQQGIREQRPMALLMIDIDCFKPYNDRYGHQAGDEVLKQVAGLLAQGARRPLDLVARYGGEEFAVVLYDTTRAHAAALAERIVAEVRNLGITNAGSSCAPVVTVSVGVALVQPAPGRRPEGFVQLADAALYAAKDAGRDRVHVMQDEYAQMRTGFFEAPRRESA